MRGSRIRKLSAVHDHFDDLTGENGRRTRKCKARFRYISSEESDLFVKVLHPTHFLSIYVLKCVKSGLGLAVRFFAKSLDSVLRTLPFLNSGLSSEKVLKVKLT